jgi:hypothetical protein
MTPSKFVNEMKMTRTSGDKKQQAVVDSYSAPSIELDRSRLASELWKGRIIEDPAALDRMFDSIDKKKKGVISFNQIHRYFRAIGMPSVVEDEKIDFECSTKIRFEEFCRWFCKDQEMGSSRAQKMLPTATTQLGSSSSSMTKTVPSAARLRTLQNQLYTVTSTAWVNPHTTSMDLDLPEVGTDVADAANTRKERRMRKVYSALSPF